MGSGNPRKNIQITRGLSGSSLPVNCPDLARSKAVPATDPPELGVVGELIVQNDALVLVYGARLIATVVNAHLKSCVLMGHSYEGEMSEREGEYEVVARRT